MSAKFLAAVTVVSSLALLPTGLSAEPAGHITGVGGIFFKSKDPKALTAWYRDVLGLKIESWGGAALPIPASSPRSTGVSNRAAVSCGHVPGNFDLARARAACATAG